MGTIQPIICRQTRTAHSGSLRRRASRNSIPMGKYFKPQKTNYMKMLKFILPLIVGSAVSTFGAPAVSAGAPAASGSPSSASTGPNRPNTQNSSTPNTAQTGNVPQQNGNPPLQSGNAPQPPGTIPQNNVGNGTYINGMPGNNVGNGTFIQPGSPAIGGQMAISNNVTGQYVTGQNTNPIGRQQQYNQQAWMTNRPPLQTNGAYPQSWMTNTSPIKNTPPQ
jgi:hypothetical protein